MSQFIKFPPADGDLNSGELRAILEACRLDLDSLRKDMAHDSGCHAGQASRAEHVRLERRLCRVVVRLERVTDTLDEALNRTAVQPSAIAAAEVLAREADHRIRNRLQAVTALLERQAIRAETDAARDALNLAVTRMEAVAQVYARLHAVATRHGVVPDPDLGSYLGRLCAALGRSVRVGRKRHATRGSGAVGCLGKPTASLDQTDKGRVLRPVLDLSQNILLDSAPTMGAAGGGRPRA